MNSLLVSGISTPSRVTLQNVQLEISDLEHIALADHTTTQQRADAQHQLGERERFDEVIVGAEFEAADAVADMIARGQENHRQVAPRPQRTHDFPAVDARQHHVQHHEVVRVFQRHVQAVRSGACEIDRIAAFAQPLLQVVAGFRIVFDDEDAHGAGCSNPNAPPRAWVMDKDVDMAAILRGRGAPFMTFLSSVCHSPEPIARLT
jgi:hypothetical protein